MEIKENVPVRAYAEVKINADPELVWNVLIDVKKWPTWNPDIKNVVMGQKFTVGSQFKWKSGPGTITSKLQEIEKPKLLVWTGKTMGIHAVHIWRLKPIDGQTLISSEESWDGLLVKILSGSMQKTLQKSIESTLKYLKLEIEK
ncbi:MAG: SRPBCC family protein [Methanobacterium sp. ERen5]|nr:MAG: SRPBCC family protein [Methanobacterium sp. ERen5]